MDEQTDAVPREAGFASATVGSDEGDIFRKILDIAADAIVTVDESQHIVHFNHGAERMFGYSADEVHGKPLDMLLPVRFRHAHPRYVEQFGESAESARLMGHRREVFGLRSNGREFPAEASILKLERPGGGRLYTAVVRDVTDRKRMDEQQRFLAVLSGTLSGSLDYEATLRTIVEFAVPALADACILDIVVDDRDELRRLVSSVAVQHPALDALCDRFAPTWNSPSVVVDVIRTRRSELMSDVTDEWLESHTENADEAELMRAAGACSMIVAPMVARDEVLGALTLLSRERGRYDATDMQLALNAAARAALALDNARLYGDARHASRARDEVLAVVSHDLRNPLSAISMCSRVLAENPPKDPIAFQELASTIRMSADWMSRLIQDLLDVSAIEAGRLSVTPRTESIASVLERVESLFAQTARERGITLHVASSDDVPSVYADGERLVQAIANLVGNALKFTERGGRVTVSVRAEPDVIAISVTDTGHGIPAADIPRIFDRFWHASGSGSERGSGLGLAITRGIMDAHGGDVRVTSTEGAGSTFTITIPREARRT